MFSWSPEQTHNERRAEQHWKHGDLTVSTAPHWVQLLGNTNCNIRCPFCFAWDDITRPRDQHTDLSPQALESLLEFITRGTRMVEMIGGGEILLSHSFWQFLRMLDRNALDSFGILSNFVAPIEDVQLLADKLDYVKISVAGATADVYESLMRGGKWERLLSNIEAARAAGLAHLWFICILHQTNKHQIQAMMELCDRLGVGSLVFKQLDKGPNMQWYGRENVAEEAPELAAEINRLKEDYRVRVYSDLEHGGSGLLVFADSVKEAQKRGYVCKSPWHSIEPHLDGVVRPCCYNMQVSYGNINTDSIDDLWNGPAVREFRRDLVELRYTGCNPRCPDLAVQLRNEGENEILAGVSRKAADPVAGGGTGQESDDEEGPASRRRS